MHGNLLAPPMRLSEFLEQDDIKRAGIRIIGSWKTDASTYVILGRGEAPFPIAGINHPILVGPQEQDPELQKGEAATIRRRFGLDKFEFRTNTPDST